MSTTNTPIIKSLNNDVLSTKESMPNKSPYSVNENRFSMGRFLYSKTINTVVNETPENVKEKRFYGMRNSDASSVMEKKKYLAQGRKNHNNVPISFQGKSNGNESRQALSRVRNRGAIVPSKITGRIQ
jgi:hypothetical protein